MQNVVISSTTHGRFFDVHHQHPEIKNNKHYLMNEVTEDGANDKAYSFSHKDSMFDSKEHLFTSYVFCIVKLKV